MKARRGTGGAKHTSYARRQGDDEFQGQDGSGLCERHRCECKQRLAVRLPLARKAAC